MSDEIRPCFQCGSQPDEIDYTAVVEYYGIDDQTGSISCSGTNREYCPVEVSISFDQDGKGNNVDAVLLAAWNLLNQQ